MSCENCTKIQNETQLEGTNAHIQKAYGLWLTLDENAIHNSIANLIDSTANHKAEVRISYGEKAVEMTYQEFLEKVGLAIS